MKNQKGMTLVELLAVIVILAIVTAIAVPSVGGLINKSRTDAHISNGLMIINAAKIGVAAQDDKILPSSTGTRDLKLSELVSAGYLDNIPQDPSKKGDKYNDEKSKVTITKDSNGKYNYTIVLVSSGGTEVVNADESKLNAGNAK